MPDYDDVIWPRLKTHTGRLLTVEEEKTLVGLASQLAQMLRDLGADDLVVCGMGLVDQGLVSAEFHNRRVTGLLEANTKLVDEKRMLERQLAAANERFKVMTQVFTDGFGRAATIENLAQAHGIYSRLPGEAAVRTIERLERELKDLKEKT